MRGSFKRDFEAASPWSFMGVQGLSIFAGFQEGFPGLCKGFTGFVLGILQGGKRVRHGSVGFFKF